MENRNNITEFILLGLSQKKEFEILCFLLFLLCYIAILIGNLLVTISIASSQLMKQPMYFFLSYLSLADLCYTSTVTPKLIADLLAAKKIISYHGCMTQLFTMHFFAGMRSSSSRGRPMIAMWPSASLCAALWSWPDRSALPWSLLPALGASCIPSVSFSWPSFYTTAAPTK